MVSFTCVKKCVRVRKSHDKSLLYENTAFSCSKTTKQNNVSEKQREEMEGKGKGKESSSACSILRKKLHAMTAAVKCFVVIAYAERNAAGD